MQMRDISLKYEFTNDFLVNDENWDYQEMETRRHAMSKIISTFPDNQLVQEESNSIEKKVWVPPAEEKK